MIDARRALVVGAFGQDNPGDEGLLASTVMAVRRAPGWEPVVATARPAETAARLGVATVAATARDTARAAAGAHALVVGGGTVFKELHPSSGRPAASLLLRTLMITRAMRARGCPVAMIGVGAAPVDHPRSRALVRAITRHLDLLVLRDAESAEVLAEIGVPVPLRVGADLAWLSLAPTRPGDVLCGPIGVAVSHLAGGPHLIDRLGSALRTLSEGGEEIELEPWQGDPVLGYDARVAARLAERVGPRGRVVSAPEDLDEAVRRSSGRSAVLAMRFHAAVTAAHARTPFLAVAHEPKLAGIARRLGQPAVAVDANEAAIVAALESVVRGHRPTAAAVLDEHRRAEATADLLALVLDGGGDARRLDHIDLVPAPVPA